MSTPNVSDPEVWPVCDCGTAFVHRLAWTMAFGKPATSGVKWVWQRDCKHPKKETHDHTLMTAKGPYVPPKGRKKK